ncbi:MAG: RloB family protein [Rikenellaceae bacterium]
MRKRKPTQNTRQAIHIVGEGQTELFYFKHLKSIMGYKYFISPRLFENNSIAKIEKKVEELLREDVYVICVFDADVSRRSEAENQKLQRLNNKYSKNDNVLLCDSLQSIEYWFLLHFEDTCRHFNDAAATERALKKYIPNYDKGRKFLENEKWVRDMTLDGRLETACERAEKYKEQESYSNLHQAITRLKGTSKN